MTPDQVNAAAGPSRAASQTLSRGLKALEVLAEANEPLTIAELSARLGLHRSVTYRIVRTLEDHRVVVRDPTGALRLGPGLAALARSVFPDLQSAALPELTTLANDLAMTAFIGVLDGDNVTTLISVEPLHTHVTVAQRPGTRHSVEVGAPGLAIQSVLTPAERNALLRGHAFRADSQGPATGYATSHDEVIKGLASIAVPIRVPGYPPSAVAVVYLHEDVDVVSIAGRLRRSAEAITSTLG